jgi:hypothetical protein
MQILNPDTTAANKGGGIAFGGSYTGTTQTYFSNILGAKENGTDGNLAGYLSFYTRTSGAGYTAERMRIDSSGNVNFYASDGTTPAFHWAATDERLGIGTSSPSQGIHLKAASGNSYIKAERTTANQGEVGFNTDNWYMYQKTNDTSLHFYNTADRMTIDSSGNVGIGTDSPTTKLQSKGGSIASPTDNAGLIANASASFVVNHGNDYGLYTGYVASANDAIGIAATRTGGTALPLSLQPFGGNVGIGTNSPSVALDVLSSSEQIICSFAHPSASTDSVNGGALVRIQNTNATNGNQSSLIFADSASTGSSGIFGFNTNHTTHEGYMVFGTRDSAGSAQTMTERMRIDSSGNLLVGTSGVVVDLVVPAANVITDQAFGINNGSNKTQYSQDRINFNSGQYYVLNESNSGVILTNGNTSWASQSDESLKENISDLGPVLDKVTAYRCVNYSLKSTESSDADKIGFIAQDWESDFPNVVDADENGLLIMRYTETIPVLLKAIQEQQATITALTDRITALENA